MADNLKFDNYTRDSFWYGGRITKYNLGEAAEFIKRCNGGEVVVRRIPGIITFSNNAVSFAHETKGYARVGDYLARKTNGPGGQVEVFKEREFRDNFTLWNNYSQLRQYALTKTEYNVLRAIATNESDCFYAYSFIEDYTATDRKETKQAVTHLRELGVLEYKSGLMSDDGEVQGSGFGFDSPLQEILAELLMRRYQNYRFDPDLKVL